MLSLVRTCPLRSRLSDRHVANFRAIDQWLARRQLQRRLSWHRPPANDGLPANHTVDGRDSIKDAIVAKRAFGIDQSTNGTRNHIAATLPTSAK